MSTGKLHPGARDADAEVSLVLRFDASDFLRLQRACEAMAERRGAPYSIHDLLCDGTSMLVDRIEAGTADAAPSDGGAP